MTTSRAKSVLRTAVIAPLSLALLMGTGAQAAGMRPAKDCKMRAARISPLQIVACEGFIACYKGDVRGAINGSFTSALTNLHLDPVAKTWSYSALSVLTLSDGTVRTSDAGTASIDFKHATEVLTMTEGTGAYAGYTATFTASGGYLGGRPGHLQGWVCPAAP